MKTVNFIFGIHNHQPVGNFDFVVEDAFQKSYLPFVEVVEEFPNLHISLHFSGCLLEWLEKQHPEYLDRIARLVERGNVEIISGGFYEPVLAMIPDRDKIGQIKMMNDYIRKRFKYNPRGLWLTERVWEPSLAKPIAEADIAYITVDDYHFLGAGKMERELTAHYITEEQGKTLSIFPINQKLRYAIPFKDPQLTLDYLGQFATEDGNNAIVMADDGEKFGVWPGTYESVFENNWLREFCQLLEANRDWIKTRTFSEYYESHPPKGRIYLPTASYFEMSEWSLPWEAGENFAALVHEFENESRFDQIKPFIKGGIWRNFLVKYDESNWMQKKVLHLSERIENIDVSKLTGAQKDDFAKARQHLWRSMCNCAYWHGIFGGLYLPHLRHAVYEELLRSERLLNEIQDRRNFFVETTDFDGDGLEEILVTHQNLYAVFTPQKGAVMNELSLLDNSFNLLNTLKRYQEAYHKKVLEGEKKQSGGSIHDQIHFKEAGLERYLKYDSYPRKNLVDHIIHPSVSLEQFRNGEYFEDSDFIQGRYTATLNRKTASVLFRRDGWINWQKFTISKEIKFRKSALSISYTLSNTDEKRNTFRFGPEFNFALLGGNSPDRYYLVNGQKPGESALNTVGNEIGIQQMSVVNEWDKFVVTLKTAGKADFWRFPVETVSLSEAGFERVYQSSVIVPFFNVSLDAGESRTIALELTIRNL